MIFVKDRGPEPASLSSEATVHQRDAAVTYYKTWKRGDAGFGGFDRYRLNDVKAALATIFRRKCAYCEKILEKATMRSSTIAQRRQLSAIHTLDTGGSRSSGIIFCPLVPAAIKD